MIAWSNWDISGRAKSFNQPNHSLQVVPYVPNTCDEIKRVLSVSVSSTGQSLVSTYALYDDRRRYCTHRVVEVLLKDEDKLNGLGSEPTRLLHVDDIGP